MRIILYMISMALSAALMVASAVGALLGHADTALISLISAGVVYVFANEKFGRWI
jgi:hypothetical protein